MYEKEIVRVIPEKNSSIIVLFSNGEYRRLDLSILYNEFPEFKALEDFRVLSKFKIMANVIIKWNDELELVADTIYEKSVLCTFGESSTIPLLGYRLKKARLEKDISQQKLAKLTGIDQSEISKLENGCINPSIEYIEKITQVLGKRLEILVK